MLPFSGNVAWEQKLFYSYDILILNSFYQILKILYQEMNDYVRNE